MAEEKKLGVLLVSKEVITQEQLDVALREQKRTGKLLGETLVDQGFISDKDLATVLADQTGETFIDIKNARFHPEAIALVPEDFARKHLLVPITAGRGMFMVAMKDPMDIDTIDELQKMTGRYVDVLQATESDLLTALDRCYGKSTAEKSIKIDELVANAEAAIGTQKNAAEEGGVSELVDFLITQAVKLGATDIHIEPTRTIVRVRYRVDGILEAGPVLPKTLQAALVTRLKIMANLDISITRAPQDGQFQFKYGSKKLSLRFSSYPISQGEKMVMRLLDSSSLQVDLTQLGYLDYVLPQYQQILQKPYGVILMTGPTGSGKSTTLYSSLSYINSFDKNIMTIEDPIEYSLPLICQAQVNEKAGLTFAAGLRTMLRQDPDIIMVGEMRDGETVRIAIQAALTGHLVLSTLHTNEAAGAFPRLADMGAESFLVASSVVCVVAQRLVRRICEHCIVEDTEITEAHEQALEQLGKTLEEVTFRKGEGCDTCNGSGNRGRVAVTEVLIVTDEIRQHINSGADSRTIERTAVEQGMLTLQLDALTKVGLGWIALETLEKSGLWQRTL